MTTPNSEEPPQPENAVAAAEAETWILDASAAVEYLLERPAELRAERGEGGRDGCGRIVAKPDPIGAENGRSRPHHPAKNRLECME